MTKNSTIRVVWMTEECGYCDLLYRAVNSVLRHYPELKHAWMQSLSRITLVEGQPVLLRLNSPAGRGRPSNVGIELFKLPDVDVPGLPTVGSLAPVAPSADSEECFAFINSCIKECTETHLDC